MPSRLEAKKRTARIGKASELWDLERWLGERRTHLDRDYDYRCSVLSFVFAHLLRGGRLPEQDLNGLDRQKLDAIRLPVVRHACSSEATFSDLIFGSTRRRSAVQWYRSCSEHGGTE